MVNVEPGMTQDSETIEIELLVDAIFRKYGYDFRNYSRASLKRRLKYALAVSEEANFSAMQHRLLYDSTYFESLLLNLTVNVTEMFRDPTFYRSLRENVLPVLRTYPFIKIWHAGCSTGEEVYSMAIMLKEEKLLKNAMLYATDIDAHVLKKAKDGIYSLDRIREFTQNYQRAGGQFSFADYYTARYDAAIMDGSLKKNIVFSQHNLVTDGAFGEMNMIVCRNVIIYFNRDLQNRVLRLFHDSLGRKGLLCLGSKETTKYLELKNAFEEIDGKEKIFRRIR
jgi:chemotaxis protein methyltransferase CheR